MMQRPVRPRKRRRPGAAALLLIIALTAVAVLIIGNRVFVVRDVSVDGNRYVTDEEVVLASGILLGDSMFSIDTAKVRQGINENRYLTFGNLWREFPNRVVLHVSEISPRATLTWSGMLYMIGEGGIVLEETSLIDIENRVPLITGIQLKTARAGQAAVFSVAGQGDAIENVLDELERQGFLTDVVELNVASPESMYLLTVDGLQVMLGDDQLLSEKIMALRGFLLLARGQDELRGGVLNVTSGTTADYRKPTSTQ